MNAAHILLGCPWQFDRKTKHDGFQNTYSFKNDGVNITLVPFDSQEKKIISEAPLQVQPLLREFADVIPSDIPPGLPAIRDIQHCIDFIPGSAIPNRPAYRMNPKEFVELQRQVTELLEKGLIRESMSPCAVPALLDYNGSNPFFKIDLRSGYHHIRMRPGDEMKASFKTPRCDYTSDFMPLRTVLIRRVDSMRILISSLEQHLSHLRQIFSVLRAQKLYANGKKCHFLVTETSEAAKAFDILKAKVTEASILALPNFVEVFQVKCDASGVGIGGVQSQNQRPIPFFSEKLNDVRCKYSTYDKEFYAIVRSLDTWRHYLLSNEFVLFSDHEALKFINGQHKLKPRHAKWVEFIQDFSFVIRHKVGSNNQVADALSRRHLLITTMHIRVQGFDLFSGLYCDDPDFREIWSKCDNAIFRGHPGLPRTQRAKDSVMVVVDRFIKDGIICTLSNFDASQVARLYFAEIVKLHGVPKTLTSDRDVKFVSHFWRTLWTRLGSKITVIMYTHGRKKADAEPTPPARDPHDVETIERLQQRIQKLKLQQPRPDSPAEEAETELTSRTRNRDDRCRDDPIRSLGLKIEIPEFTGKNHLDDFIDWLCTTEWVFDVRDIPDKPKVKIVAIKLRQHASLW
ncbi:RNA-directed DNA polymerase [Tanacetum coccineum]